MRRCLQFGVFLAALLVSAREAAAHITMLLPDKASVKKGETVTVVYQFGHPFEHQLFDAPAPEMVLVYSPEGKKTDLTKTLEKIKLPGADKKEVTAFRFRFTPEERGDYTFVLQTPPMWMEDDKEYVYDTAQVVLHVQAERGWDAGHDFFALKPLTRPYGLEPGMVFQAQVQSPRERKPVASVPVAIERYNAKPPKQLPPDEHITRTARADPNAVVTCTLTEAGWWSITATRSKAEIREIQGKQHPLTHRTTLWVWVDEKVAGKYR